MPVLIYCDPPGQTGLSTLMDIICLPYTQIYFKYQQAGMMTVNPDRDRTHVTGWQIV